MFRTILFMVGGEGATLDSTRTDTKIRIISPQDRFALSAQQDTWKIASLSSGARHVDSRSCYSCAGLEGDLPHPPPQLPQPTRSTINNSKLTGQREDILQCDFKTAQPNSTHHHVELQHPPSAVGPPLGYSTRRLPPLPDPPPLPSWSTYFQFLPCLHE